MKFLKNHQFFTNPRDNESLRPRGSNHDMANYFDEEGVDGKSYTEEKAVDEKEQDIIEDGGIKTKFKIRVVEEEVKPMTHIFFFILF
jgi:hypothetical protein